eukprot:3934138-Rhodomonas_salina.3
MFDLGAGGGTGFLGGAVTAGNSISMEWVEMVGNACGNRAGALMASRTDPGPGTRALRATV